MRWCPHSQGGEVNIPRGPTAEDQHFHLPLSSVVSPGASHDLTSPLLRPGWTMEVVLLGQTFPGMCGGLTLWGMEWVEAGWPELVSSHHSPTWKEKG